MDFPRFLVLGKNGSSMSPQEYPPLNGGVLKNLKKSANWVSHEIRRSTFIKHLCNPLILAGGFLIKTGHSDIINF